MLTFTIAALVAIATWGPEAKETGARWLMFGVACAAGTILASQLAWFWHRYRAPMDHCHLFTPLYFIKTRFGEVSFWSLTDITEFTPTHHYTNGSYQHTSIVVRLPDCVEEVTIRSKSEAERLFHSLRRWAVDYTAAYRTRDWNYFARHDLFADAQTEGSRADQARKDRRNIIAASCLPGLVAGITLFIWVLHASDAKGARDINGYAQRQATPAAIAPATPQRRTAPPPVFDQPFQPLPWTGVYQSHTFLEAIAPLEIRTRGGMNYFVKVSDWYSDRLVTTVFIRAGATASVKVPIGTYRIKFAAGNLWYGERYLFGPSTGFSSADTQFTFSRRGNYVEGNTIELFLQPNGNLRMSTIGADDF